METETKWYFKLLTWIYGDGTKSKRFVKLDAFIIVVFLCQIIINAMTLVYVYEHEYLFAWVFNIVAHTLLFIMWYLERLEGDN